MKPPIKEHWIDRALAVQSFHISQCREEAGWTIKQTAEALNRSIGSVSQDILVASWIKTHEKQLRRFDSLTQALKFVRTKQREMRLGN